MGIGTLDAYRVCESMARIDLRVATKLRATFLGNDPIVVGAAPDHKKRWLTQIAEKATLPAHSATEPEARNALAAMRVESGHGTPPRRKGTIYLWRS